MNVNSKKKSLQHLSLDEKGLAFVTKASAKEEA